MHDLYVQIWHEHDKQTQHSTTAPETLTSDTAQLSLKAFRTPGTNNEGSKERVRARALRIRPCLPAFMTSVTLVTRTCVRGKCKQRHKLRDRTLLACVHDICLTGHKPVCVAERRMAQCWLEDRKQGSTWHSKQALTKAGTALLHN